MKSKMHVALFAGPLALAVSAGCDTGSSNNNNNGNTPTITATLTAGTSPRALAVNTSTNKVYVASFGALGSNVNNCGGAEGS